MLIDWLSIGHLLWIFMWCAVDEGIFKGFTVYLHYSGCFADCWTSDLTCPFYTLSSYSSVANQPN